MSITEADRSAVECAIKGDTDNLARLIDAGWDLHFDQDLILRFALSCGHLETAKFLVSKGADIHAVGDEAFNSAVESRRMENIRFLVLNGASPDALRQPERVSEESQAAIRAGILERSVLQRKTSRTVIESDGPSL